MTVIPVYNLSTISKLANLLGITTDRIQAVNQTYIDNQPGRFEIITTDGDRKILNHTALNNL